MFSTAAKPIHYRGFQIFERIKGRSFELVKDGVCLTQRAGRNGPRNLVDALYGNKNADSPWLVASARAIAATHSVVLPGQRRERKRQRRKIP
jgi:hypothetical protein